MGIVSTFGNSFELPYMEDDEACTILFTLLSFAASNKLRLASTIARLLRMGSAIERGTDGTAALWNMYSTFFI